MENDEENQELSESDRNVSVDEGKRIFGSPSALLPGPPETRPSNNATHDVTPPAKPPRKQSKPLDPRLCRQFALSCARNHVEDILEALSECPKLVAWKDPMTGYCAIHWAARKGNVDLLSSYQEVLGFDVNARTNSGFVALHIAAQFGNMEFYEFLLTKLKANPTFRDYSGKKPHQYLPPKEDQFVQTAPMVNKKQEHQKSYDFLHFGTLTRIRKTTSAQKSGAPEGHSSYIEQPLNIGSSAMGFRSLQRNMDMNRLAHGNPKDDLRYKEC